MSAGLDSIAVTDLVNLLSKRFEIELPPTLLFDHPTIGSVATHITTLLPMEISEESVVEAREGALGQGIMKPMESIMAHGPPGAGGCCRGPGLAGGRAADGFGCCC